MSFDRNTVVWASAGTGKTRKLVEVYLELLERGVDPGRIVAVTFTERAAAEMRDRIRAALATTQGRWTSAISKLAAAPISTIHGFCGILLRQHGMELGIDPSFSILDEQQSLDLAREAARETIRQEIRSGSEDGENLFRDFGLDGLVENPLEHAKEYGHTGASKPINRLLRIPNDHELSPGEKVWVVRIRGQQRNDLCLDLVGVLKFIDQQRLKLILIVPPNTVVVPQQIPGAKQQIVEIDRVQSVFLRSESVNVEAGEIS